MCKHSVPSNLLGLSMDSCAFLGWICIISIRDVLKMTPARSPEAFGVRRAIRSYGGLMIATAGPRRARQDLPPLVWLPYMLSAPVLPVCGRWQCIWTFRIWLRVLCLPCARCRCTPMRCPKTMDSLGSGGSPGGLSSLAGLLLVSKRPEEVLIT